MDQYILILTMIGLASFSISWMPRIAAFTGISYSIFYVFIGWLVYTIFPGALPDPSPQHHSEVSLHLTELVIIISLMGAGIKIDRPFSLKKWCSPLKLVSITMLLCIVASVIMGYYFLGLGLASALLLGGALAPTDPVLASDVQVGPPNEIKSETRFALTGEAGLNDGMAFPFIWLSIAVSQISTGSNFSFINWLSYDLIYKISLGVLIGYFSGRFAGYLVFKLPRKHKFLYTRDGLLAISLTLIVYGAAEMLHGYGFIAVFVCGIAVRHYEKGSSYHSELHSFTDQVERMLICILLVLFGGALANGILNSLNWQIVFFVLIFVFLIRPISGLITFSTSLLSFREKLGISFFGIKGVGSVFYLLFAFRKAQFEYQQELWTTISFAILISIVLHGLTATTVMKKLTS
ncbi:cation:proton antiporter [Pedobacter jamesrossensis]|uniref:cation:proton antiporter n=1 Tax=Pedobacter jamesrossensis TaxID=1908238 RepID=UPI0036119E3B